MIAKLEKYLSLLNDIESKAINMIDEDCLSDRNHIELLKLRQNSISIVLGIYKLENKNKKSSRLKFKSFLKDRRIFTPIIKKF